MIYKPLSETVSNILQAFNILDKKTFDLDVEIEAVKLTQAQQKNTIADELKEKLKDDLEQIKEDAKKDFDDEIILAKKTITDLTNTAVADAIKAKDEVVKVKQDLAVAYDALKKSVDYSSNFGIYRILPANNHYVVVNMPNERISSYLIPYFEKKTGKPFEEIVEFVIQLDKISQTYHGFIPGVSKVGSTDDFFFNYKDKSGVVEAIPFLIKTKENIKPFMFEWSAFNVQGTSPNIGVTTK